MSEQEKEDIKNLLYLIKSGIFPGKGKMVARTVHETCKTYGLDEDEFLQNYVKKDKKKWGL